MDRSSFFATHKQTLTSCTFKGVTHRESHSYSRKRMSLLLSPATPYNSLLSSYPYPHPLPLPSPPTPTPGIVMPEGTYQNRYSSRSICKLDLHICDYYSRIVEIKLVKGNLIANLELLVVRIVTNGAPVIQSFLLAQVYKSYSSNVSSASRNALVTA